MNNTIKTLAALLMSVVTIGTTAQTNTARKFVLKNSADGQSELTVYLPANPTGMAVVDCPGGGYTHLSMENEGHDWANYYNDQGVAFVVLKYRMPKGDRNIPLSDAYNAMRTVRDSAKVWHINPRRVGIQGFSAGGHLASTVSTHAPLAVRPDFSILFYPVISMNEKITHKGSCVGFLGDKRGDEKLVKEWSSDKQVRRHLTPPAIIIAANDDRAVPPVTNGVAYYSAMRSSGNKCAMMIYPSGGHGFGFRSSFRYHDQMLAELTSWLHDLSLPEENDVKVACVGNSITDGHGIDMQEVNAYPAVLDKNLGKGFEARNFGVSSRTMSNQGDYPYQKEQAWRDCLDWNPDVVVIKLGTNDSKPHNWAKAKDDFIPCLGQMIDSLRRDNRDPRIILCAPIPAFKDSWGITDSTIVNAIIPDIKTVAENYCCEYLDLYTPFIGQQELIQKDGIHPNEKGAAKIAEIVADAVKKERPVFNKKKTNKLKKRKAN